MNRLTREELLSSDEYLIGNIQFELYHDIRKYLEESGINQTDFANELNVTKGYVSQILNGEFDHKLSRLIKLYKAIGIAVTGLQKIPMPVYLEADKFKHEALELRQVVLLEANNHDNEEFQDTDIQESQKFNLIKESYQNGFTGYTR